MKFAIFLQHYFPYGGLQRDAVRLAQAAVDTGDTPTIIVSTWTGPEPEHITIIELNSGGHSNHDKAARFSAACKKIIESKNFDTSICFSRVPSAPFHFCGDPCYLDKFTQTKNSILRLFPRYRYLIKTENAIFGVHSTTHLFFLAESEIPAYQQFYPINKERFTLLPPWLKRAETFEKSRETTRKEACQELNISEDNHLMLFVGSDFKRKGLARAIEALVGVKSSNLHLVVCGQYDPTAYLKQASELGIAHRVHFLGPRNDIPRWMMSSSLLIHPAHQETAGMVLIEALSYGLPVTCTELCGYAGYVNEAGGTLLSNDCPASEISKTIHDMLENQSKLSDQALEWAANPAHYQTAKIILDTMRQTT